MCRHVSFRWQKGPGPALGLVEGWHARLDTLLVVLLKRNLNFENFCVTLAANLSTAQAQDLTAMNIASENNCICMLNDSEFFWSVLVNFWAYRTEIDDPLFSVTISLYI